MNKIQKKRLLNVALACRTTKHVDNFTMEDFVVCGSPACAIGNYAFQRKLQRTFVLDGHMIYNNDGTQCFLKSPWYEVIEHFGITRTEANELFNESGCDNAQTNIQAAEYIEAFVARQ